MDDWTEKLNYLVRDELPRRISRGRSPRRIGMIHDVKTLADALGRNRQSVYGSPSGNLLKEIRYLYQIPDKGDCRAELEAGTFESFRDEYRALHQPYARDEAIDSVQKRPNLSAAEGEFIYQLDKKVDALVETMGELGKINPTSRVKLAHFARISPNLLEVACATGLAPQPVASSLAEFCRFDVDDPTWIDRLIAPDQKSPSSTYCGRDSAINFRRYLRGLWKLELGPTLVLKPSHLEMLDPDLASFALSDLGQETQTDQPLCVFLQLDMTPAWEPSGYAYGFRKVRIRLILDNDGGIEIRKRLGYPNDVVKLSNATLQARGTTYQPFWELLVDEGILHGEYATREQYLFEILRARQGLGFAAELSFQLHDGSLLRNDNRPIIGKAKEAIIERLMAKRIAPDSGSQGWLVLGKQVLRISAPELP